MKGLDTNVLIRHLIQDDPAQFRLATHFITTECSREDPCYINRIVLCETVWVLESAYGYAREDIAGVLERIIRTYQFRIEDVQADWTALRLYGIGKKTAACERAPRAARCGRGRPRSPYSGKACNALSGTCTRSRSTLMIVNPAVRSQIFSGSRLIST